MYKIHIITKFVNTNIIDYKTIGQMRTDVIEFDTVDQAQEAVLHINTKSKLLDIYREATYLG